MKSNRSYRNQKRRNVFPLIVILALSPYIFGFQSPDSSLSYDEIRYGFGGGQYVTHDCSGAHKRQYLDAGIYLGEKFGEVFRGGLAADVVTTGTNGTTAFVFPDLALDWENFSVGTTGLRVGSENTYYGEIKWFDQPPLISGKGLFRAGIGGKLDKPFSRFWIGTNVVPYFSPGIASQLEIPINNGRYIFINGRFGKDADSHFNEFGISIGLKIISFRTP